MVVEQARTEILSILNSLLQNEFFVSLGVSSTASGLRLALLRSKYVADLRQKLVTWTEFTESLIREFVDKTMMPEFKPGVHFAYESSLAAIAVALETHSTQFAEEYLLDLFKLKYSYEITMAASVAALSLNEKGLTVWYSCVDGKVEYILHSINMRECLDHIHNDNGNVRGACFYNNKYGVVCYDSPELAYEYYLRKISDEFEGEEFIVELCEQQGLTKKQLLQQALSLYLAVKKGVVKIVDNNVKGGEQHHEELDFPCTKRK